MIQLRTGILWKGAVVAGTIARPLLSFLRTTDWEVGGPITWTARGLYLGPERYLLRLELASGYLCGWIVVDGEGHLKGQGVLWTETTAL